MTISAHINDFLTAKGIAFEMIHHFRSEGTAQSAITAHVPLTSMAKAVVMEDHDGHHVMAVVPCSEKVKVHELEKITQSQLNLVSEEELTELFDDCDVGAIPALGPAYHMETYLDKRLLEEPMIYIESGDHQCVLELSNTDFMNAMENAHQADISETAGEEAVIQY